MQFKQLVRVIAADAAACGMVSSHPRNVLRVSE